MFRLFLLIMSLSYTALSLAQSNYQIDLIVFAHPKNTEEARDLIIKSSLIPIKDNSYTLGANNSSYKLLSPSLSELRDQYYQLSRRSPFKVLGQYSWRQTTSKENKIALPAMDHQGWQVQGSVQVRQSTYYLFDAQLHISPPDDPQSYFTVSQKQRLKGSTVYFLDHPQIGMLVKIHKLS